MATTQRNRIINKKYLGFILFSFLILLLPGIPFIVGLMLVWLSVGLTTLKSPSTGLVGICFMESFYGFVRWKEFTSVLLAGFSFEIVIIFLIGVILYTFKCKKREVKVKLSNIFNTVFLMYILWLCIRSIIYVDNLLEVGLVFRQFILMPLSFFAICFALRRNHELPKYILMALCLGSASLALINLVHYFYGLSIPWSRFFMINDNTIDCRILFGFELARMYPLLLGQGPGGAGAFYMVHAVTSFGCLVFLKMNIFWKLVLIIAFCILIIAAVCTVAYSAFIVIPIALFVLVQQMKLNVKKIICVCLLFCLSILIIFGSIIGGRGNYYKASSYILDLSKYTFSVIPEFGSSKFVFGSGPAIKTGVLINADRGNKDLEMLKGSHDQWWFVVLNQMGIIGLLLAVLFVCLVIIKYFKVVSSGFGEKHNSYLPCAGILFFCLFGYVHGFAFFVQPFNFSFVIALALIMTSGSVISLKMKANKAGKTV